MPELPSGTVTFLFTDIEGSTTRWEHQPEAMGAALARHDALLRTVIAGHHGYVVKTMGDAFHAVFVRAQDAVGAALDAQRRLQTESWGTIGSIRVRMALHTGAAEERDGDYFGPPLNRAARLMSAGHGGQILLSQSTYELVRDSPSDGVTFVDLGEHRLKDLIRPERVFQVTGTGIPPDFPPLNSLNVRPHNLPLQTTPLLGRDQEVRAVSSLLLHDDVRLATLTGPGGTGKTRLSLQVAADLLDRFEDGAFLVELAPISDPALVVSTIAQALGVQGDVGRLLLDVLVTSLCDRQLLLVLDNFEQVLAAATVVDTLLRACPRLCMLVTSRAALQLRGEHEYPVPPLALPDSRHAYTPEALSQYGAVALFIERATAIKPDFAVTNANAPAVAEICVRLDGLPLAIELAAARIRLLSPEAMLPRLGHGLTLLAGGRRDLPARQQTLRGAIAWSYDLLSETERRLFRLLGVFVGGFTLEAAEGMCHGILLESTGHAPAIDVLDGIGSLVNHSLVRSDETPDGELRFRMLEMIREYALEQLEASGETQMVRERHREYFVVLGERAMPALKGREGQTWLNRLETEHDNLRLALDWCLMDNASAGAGLKLVGALWPFWWTHGHLLEGERWSTMMLAAGADAPADTRANALLKAGYLAHNLGDFVRADARFGASLELYRSLEDRPNIADALRGLGIVADVRGEHEHAVVLFEESLTLSRGAGDDQGTAWGLSFVGNALRHLGRYDQAEAILRDALRAFRSLGRESAIARVLGLLGKVAHDLGDEVRAAALSAEALAMSERLGDRQASSFALTTLGWIAIHQDDSEGAAPCFTEALRLSRRSGDALSAARAIDGLSAVAVGQGRAVDAARYLGTAEVLREATGAQLPLSERADQQRMVLATRAMIGEMAYTKAWAEGRAMTREQAFAFALERPAPPDERLG